MNSNRERLELNDDPAFQRAEWRVQRVGWILWMLILLLALAGVTGTGPLSSTQTSAPDGSVTVAYDRFLHYHKPSVLELTIRPDDSDAGPIDVQISSSFLDAVEIHRIEPEPERRQLEPAGVVYTFLRHESLQHAKVRLHVEYERFGRRTGEIRLVGHKPASLTQFVYP